MFPKRIVLLVLVCSVIVVLALGVHLHTPRDKVSVAISTRITATVNEIERKPSLIDATTVQPSLINQPFNISNRDRQTPATSSSPTVNFLVTYNHTTIRTTSDMLNNLVCLTATSNNHFHEIQGMLKTVHRCFPQNKIIVYDLGLTATNRDSLGSKFSNIELRSFPFDNYTHLPHVKRLHTYAWKPIIFDLVSQEYDIIMYGDASLRMRTCNIDKALEHILHKFPLLNVRPLYHRAVEFTHDGMIDYLHFPKARKDIATIKTLEASGWLMWVTSPIKKKVIEPWLDCALHQECIAPNGTILWPCNFTAHHDGHYVGCHRYDQSAINLILVREFGMNMESKASDESISGKLWTIQKEN